MNLLPWSVWLPEALEPVFSKRQVFDAKRTEEDNKDTKVNGNTMTVSLPKLSVGNTSLDEELLGNTLANGDTSYVNDGTHIIRMRWGEVISLHAYIDTEKVVTVFRQMAKEGFAEAAAAPIED